MLRARHASGISGLTNSANEGALTRCLGDEQRVAVSAYGIQMGPIARPMP
jgi:hypothetical protein